eukprot:1855305-Pleurochrysis_carterae.AAC.5
MQACGAHVIFERERRDSLLERLLIDSARRAAHLRHAVARRRVKENSNSAQHLTSPSLEVQYDEYENKRKLSVVRSRKDWPSRDRAANFTQVVIRMQIKTARACACTKDRGTAPSASWRSPARCARHAAVNEEKGPKYTALVPAHACIRSWSSFGEYECECGGARPGARPLPRPLPCERHAELVWPPTWASCSAPSRSAASRAKPRGVMAQGRSDSEGRLGDASGGSNTLVEPPVRADGVRRDEDLRLRNSDWSRMSSGAAAAVRVGVLMCDCLKDEEERVHAASGSRRGDSRFGRGEISLLRNLVPPVPA